MEMDIETVTAACDACTEACAAANATMKTECLAAAEAGDMDAMRDAIAACDEACTAACMECAAACGIEMDEE